MWNIIIHTANIVYWQFFNHAIKPIYGNQRLHRKHTTSIALYYEFWLDSTWNIIVHTANIVDGHFFNHQTYGNQRLETMHMRCSKRNLRFAVFSSDFFQDIPANLQPNYLQCIIASSHCNHRAMRWWKWTQSSRDAIAIWKHYFKDAHCWFSGICGESTCPSVRLISKNG